MPPIELDPKEIGNQLDKVFKKRKEAALQATTSEGGENIESTKNDLSKVTKFREAIKKYKDSTHTPELETEYWQASWEYYGSRIGLKIKVPECDRTMQEKRELEEKGRKLIYVPPNLSTHKGLDLLNEMYPTLQLDTENITNEKDVSGWIDVESSPNVQNKGTTEIELREKYEKNEKIGMNLNVYIISSIESKDREGKYFDEQTWARLSSLKNGRMLDAGFKPDGSLHIDTPSPETADLFLGGRSMGVKAV